MCIRTKTSYGCGHTFKSTEDCSSSRCKGLDRFHIEKPGDCRSCKAGGDSIRRGQDGLGRYATEHRLRDPQQYERRQPLTVVSNDSEPRGRRRARTPSPSPLGASPWAASEHTEYEEKLWSTSIRQEADSGWLREHADRQVLSARNTTERDSDEENRYPKQSHSSYQHQRKRSDYHGRPQPSSGAIQVPTMTRNDRRRTNDNQYRDRYNSFESFPSASSASRPDTRPRHVHEHRDIFVFDESRLSLHQTPRTQPRYEYRDPYTSPSQHRPRYDHDQARRSYDSNNNNPSRMSREGSFLEVRTPEQYAYGRPSPPKGSYGYERATPYAYDTGFEASPRGRRRY